MPWKSLREGAERVSAAENTEQDGFQAPLAHNTSCVEVRSPLPGTHDNYEKWSKAVREAMGVKHVNISIMSKSRKWNK